MTKQSELAKRPTPLDPARKAWNEHAARCFECKAAKSKVCEEGRPLLKAVLELMGVNR
jgi:hypothetical protein